MVYNTFTTTSPPLRNSSGTSCIHCLSGPSIAGIVSLGLVVGLQLHPVAWPAIPQDVLPYLIEHEDEKGEGGGGEPPVDLQGVHLQPLVHAGGVGQEGGQEGLEHQAKVHDPVVHPLCPE